MKYTWYYWLFSRLASESLEENKKKVDVQLKEITSERDSLTRNLSEALQSLKQVKIMTSHIFTTRQRNCGKVVFLVVCVCLSIHGGVPCDRCPWCIGLHQEPPEVSTGGPHVTIIHDALDLTIDSPIPPPPASGIWWPRLETCSNLFTWGHPHPVLTSGVWLLKYIRWASGMYASHWNDFLLVTLFTSKWPYTMLIVMDFCF